MLKQTVLIIVLAVLFIHICEVASAQSGKVEWLDSEEYTLYWGDEINHSGYYIKAADFSPAKPTDNENDYVFLTITSIYGDSWSAILANNTGMLTNNTIFDDRLNITTEEIVTGNDIPSPYTIISVCISNSTGSLPRKVSWMDASFYFDSRVSRDVYIDERAYITLDMQNIKSIPFDKVTVMQQLPEGLVADPDLDPMWNFSFSPYEKKTLDFSVKALRPGKYNVSGAVINVEYNGRTYSKELNNSNLTIHGPFILIDKLVSANSVNQGDTVNVTLDISNEGDRAAHIQVSDQLPLGSVLVAGKTDLSQVLRANESVSLEYSIKMTRTGAITVPAGQADFVDSKEYEGTAYSKKQLIQVLGPGYNPDASGEADSNNSSSGGDYEQYNSSSQNQSDAGAAAEDHGRLQFLYDILDSITGFLKNIKDKIL